MLRFIFYDYSKITLSAHALQVTHIDRHYKRTSPRSLPTRTSPNLDAPRRQPEGELDTTRNVTQNRIAAVAKHLFLLPLLPMSLRTQ